MGEEREFRIGDLQAGLAEPGAGTRPSARAVDAGLFPLLAAWVQMPAPARRERMDALASRAREETSSEVRAALQTALRVLSEIPSLSEGDKP
jgi:hypothetical protein